MEGCGSTSSEGVAGDELSWDALAVQVKGFGSFPEGRSDLAGVDSIACRVLRAEVGANDGVGSVVGAGSDVGYPSDDGFDWANGGLSSFMMDD